MQFSSSILTFALVGAVAAQQYGTGESTSTTTISSTSTTYVTVTVMKPTSGLASSSSSAPVTTSSVVVPYPTGGTAVNYTSVGTATSWTPISSLPPNPTAPISPGAGAKLGSSLAFAMAAAAGVVGALAL